jgi:hypothetical protein
MSYNTLDAATHDDALQARVVAAVAQEAYENPAYADNAFGGAVRSSPTAGAVLLWPVAIATEAEYASALAAGNPNPGGDEAVVSDGMILSAIQANWIQDPV